MTKTERDYPHSHAVMCNVPNAGGCFTPWCTCACHYLSTITALNEDIRALAAVTLTPGYPRYRIVLTLRVINIAGRLTDVEIAGRWPSIATAGDAARDVLARVGAVRARVSLAKSS